MKKGSKAAKAWGAKMRRLRGTKKKKKRKSTAWKPYTPYYKKKKKKTTRKGQIRKTARRAYTGLKRRVSRRKKSSDPFSF